jgi:hypothetical protein
VQAQDEAQAFAAVTRHLQQRFPRLPEVRISTAVDAERQRLADARIRDFVPLLAERAAADNLRAEAVGPALLPA